MNSIDLNKNINSIVQPNIKCYVKMDKKTGASKVNLEYHSLHMRTGMVGGVKEGILDIGNNLYQNDLKKHFIQIFDEDEKLICNQEFKIHIEGQAPTNQMDSVLDFSVDV